MPTVRSPADLTASLKPRLADSNKIVQGLALDVVARIATGMGKPFDKHSRIFAAAVAGVLADQKANIRAAGIITLSAMADAAGLDTLIGGFDKPLESQNPILRKELLAWLESRFVDQEVVATLDLTPIVGAVIACLEDKNSDVRKSATALLPAIVSRAGYNFVIEQTSRLKPASRSTVLPLIETARASVPASTSNSISPPATISSRPAAPASKAPVRAGALKPLRRPESSLSLKAPTPPPDAPRLPVSPRGIVKSKALSTAASSARSTAVQTPSIREAPLRSADDQPKLVRQSRDIGSLKWMIEGTPRSDQIEALYQQMLPHVSSDLLGQLFSKDHNAEKDFVLAVTTLDDCAKDPTVAESLYEISVEEMKARLVANVDIIFKYITLRIGMSNTIITVKCLDLIDHLIPVLAGEGHRLSDYEIHSLLIVLIAKVGLLLFLRSSSKDA
jgi:cytoskeleton-associated protein 5